MKLSICIPTYNFGKFIGETLESILPELNEEVEIVILDGASTDNTAAVVQSYQKLSPQIRYFRQPEKGGIDKDMHLSVEKARGEYCWLFSSDDVMEKGAIAHILNEMRQGLDVYLCNYTICSLDINVGVRKPDILDLTEPSVFDLSNAGQRGAYFSHIVATPALFSFMSAIIVKRSRWMETAFDASFWGSCWAHVARIFSMIPNGLKVKYLPSPLLRQRSFNDSFLDKGYIHRVALAIDGYHHIADKIFGHKSHEAFHIRRALRKEFRLRLFLHAKEEIKAAEDRKTVFRLLNMTFIDFPLKNLAYKATVAALPKWAISSLRKVYLQYKNSE